MRYHAITRACWCLLFLGLCWASSAAQAIAIQPQYFFQHFAPELWPKPLRDAFNHAANEILGHALVPSHENETVYVTVRWRELGWPGPYATTGLRMSRNFAPNKASIKKDTYYPTALANHLAEEDLWPENDITLTLNISSLGEGGVTYYFGTDGKPPEGSIDFVTLVLHELIHGVGFYSTIKADGTYSDINPAGPSIYDRFIDGILFGPDGKPKKKMPLSDMPTDADRARASVWPEVLWTGPNGRANELGGLLFLHAPKTFSEDSSISHIDPTHDSLMRPGYRGVNHSIDSITLGVLEDIGWNIREGLVPLIPTGLLLLIGLLVMCLQMGRCRCRILCGLTEPRRKRPA